MVKIDIEAFKKAGYSFEEIQQIIKSEKNFEKTGKTYSVEEVFSYAREKIFSKNSKCTK